MTTAIDRKYEELGGGNGFLGRPKGDEKSTPYGLEGAYRIYDNGSIYWSPGTGAHEVHGAIREAWGDLGYEQSHLGFPTSDETRGPDGLRFSDFEFGRINWRSGTGTWVEGMRTTGAYDPPRESTAPIGETDEHRPPAGLADYWDWNNFQDSREGVATGRLTPQLREVAAARDPRNALSKAVLVKLGRIPAADRDAISEAMADLSVTGWHSFRAFRQNPIKLDELVAMTLPDSGTDEAAVRAAAEPLLGRAYDVAWMLVGDPNIRAFRKVNPMWIAVSGEDDPAHAPVNVPCTTDHMSTEVIETGIRYACRMSLKVPDPPTKPYPNTRASFPDGSNATRVLGDLVPRTTTFGGTHTNDGRPEHYDSLVLFLHGLGSRIEESDAFKTKVIEKGLERGHRFGILSIDLPGFGYSERVDIDALFAERVTGDTHGFRLPDGHGSAFPLLGLYRDCVAALSQMIHGGINHIMGGSLGGNLSLWCAEKPNFSNLPPAIPREIRGLRNVASWSPASVWESYERHRNTAVEAGLTNGARWDGPLVSRGKNGAKIRSRDRYRERESDGSRFAFFELQQRGEEFLGLHVLGAWGYPPTKSGMLLQSELYSEEYRRTFWACSNEQVEFSHREPLLNGDWPFKSIETPLMIAGGARDVGSQDVMNIYDNVIHITDACPAVPGTRHLMNHTGHSISDERPDHLADLVVDHFLTRLRPPMRW